MDRRQRRTRSAIFEAFISLLSRKNYEHITVGEIIERADVGRATFYAHFETKEFLLKELCRELFAHVFGFGDAHSEIFKCEEQADVFLHLFRHLQKNDNHILDLLSSRNNGLFLYYFKEELKALAARQLPQFSQRKAPQLPQDYWVNHIAATFVDTVQWWLENGKKEPPEQITEYFLLTI